MIRRPPRSTRTDTLFPYTTLFRSIVAPGIPDRVALAWCVCCVAPLGGGDLLSPGQPGLIVVSIVPGFVVAGDGVLFLAQPAQCVVLVAQQPDRVAVVGQSQQVGLALAIQCDGQQPIGRASWWERVCQ